MAKASGDLLLLQSRTALADTAGSAFNQQCRELFEQDNLEAVFDKLVEQFPLLFSKATAGKLSQSFHLLKACVKAVLRIRCCSLHELLSPETCAK